MRTLEQISMTRNAHLEKAEKLRAEGYALAQKKFDDLKAYYDSLYEQMVNSASKEFESAKVMLEKHATNPPKVYVSRTLARKLNNRDDPEYVAALKAAKAADPDVSVQKFFEQWQKDHPVKKVKATADSKDKKKVSFAAVIPSNTEPETVPEPPASLTKAEQKEEKLEQERAGFFGMLEEIAVDEDASDDDSITSEEIAAAKAAMKARLSEPAPEPEATPEPPSNTEPLSEEREQTQEEIEAEIEELRKAEQSRRAAAAQEAEERRQKSLEKLRDAQLREAQKHGKQAVEEYKAQVAIIEQEKKAATLADLEREEKELEEMRRAARGATISVASLNFQPPREEPSQFPRVLSTTKKPVKMAKRF